MESGIWKSGTGARSARLVHSLLAVASSLGCSEVEGEVATLATAQLTGPRAVADGVYHTRQDELLDVPAAAGVLVNDTGLPPLSASGSAITGGHGTYSVAPNGSFQYQPGAGFFGSDFFNYTLTDSAGRAAVGQVRLVVAPTAATVTVLRNGVGGFVLNSLKGRGAYEFGVNLANLGDFDGDGLDDFVTDADCLIEEVGTIACAYVVLGKRERTPLSLVGIEAGQGGIAIRGELSDTFGGMANAAGDVNGDGLADVLISNSVQGPDSLVGKAFVMFGKGDTSPVATDDLEQGLGGFAILPDPSDNLSGFFGFTNSPAGDVNGDGYADVMVGRHVHSEPSEFYLVYGKPGNANVDISQVRAGLGGFVIRSETNSGPYVRYMAAAGDVNGDGLDDMLISDLNVVPNFAGRSYVVFGKTDGAAVELSSVATGIGGFAITGSDLDHMGFGLSSAGDVNADGLADVVIGASTASPNGNFEGAAYVVFGKVTTEPVLASQIAAGSGGFMVAGKYYAVSVGGGLGGHASGAGDVDGDGKDDLIVAAETLPTPLGGQYYGGSYIVYGKADGAVVQASALETGLGGFLMNDAGGAVGGGGDLNGDGFSDVLLSDPHAGDPNFATGRVFALFGGDFTASDVSTITGTLDADLLLAENGVTVGDRLVGNAGPDTLLGDGGPDTLLGGSEDDRLAIGGAEFLVVDGGGGYDTLALRPSVPALSLDALRPRQLRSIEHVDLRNGAASELGLNVLLARRLPQGTPMLTIDGEAGDIIHVVVGAATEGVDGGSIIYALPGFSVRIRGDVTVVER